jgi:glyoxylase-like metal-dependent hydrolase (beta-lactamase superfamily II)
MIISKNVEKIELFGDQKMNCYIIKSDFYCVIIDPGYQKEIIKKYVEDNNLLVQGILLTHGHVDHVNAVDVYDTKVYIHESELEMFNNNKINGYDLFSRKKEFDVDKIQFVLVKDKDIIKFNNENIEVIHTPGHTPGSVCFKYKEFLFSGDTLFKDKVGEWRFKMGNLDHLKKSIFKIMELEDETILLPGHFDISSIDEERKNNKFYKRIIGEKKQMGWSKL